MKVYTIEIKITVYCCYTVRLNTIKVFHLPTDALYIGLINH